ncbi:hypothetical protein ACO2Q9_12165 [Variovorax sp. VNK109]|uniref:hypothetical protein n=1 Tax=Variovorax sp. VNK109 TaxID=3400919 RepID=UPI003C0C4D1B
MPTQQQIDRFTLAFHQEALRRLRANSELGRQALNVLDRWESRGASASGKIYRDEWRSLLAGDLMLLEHAVCSENERAATLRNMSPLGFVIDEPERLKIRREAMSQ